MKVVRGTEEVGGRFGADHEATDPKYGGLVALELLWVDRVEAASRLGSVDGGRDGAVVPGWTAQTIVNLAAMIVMLMPGL